MNKFLKTASILFCFGVASCSMNDNRTVGRRIDDTTLLLKVESAIHNDRKLPKTSAISVNNHGNMIQLSGFVDTQFEKEEAERITRRVERVENVINSIIVKNTAHSHVNHTISDVKAVLHKK